MLNLDAGLFDKKHLKALYKEEGHCIIFLTALPMADRVIGHVKDRYPVKHLRMESSESALPALVCLYF
jgi:hypothetical protein